MATENDKLVLDAIISPLLPNIPQDSEPALQESKTTEKDDECVKEAKELEVAGVRAAERGEIEEAIDLMNKSVELCPERASGYNNRAQVLRMKNDIEGALNDINRALELSGGKGLPACQAFTQRAMIHRLKENNEACKADFEEAAKLGSTFAQNQLIAMNPYAAMCNSMLHDVVQKLQRGDPEDLPDPQRPA